MLRDTASQGEYRAEDTPLLSIIVPVYRVRESYLRQCIESLTGQTYSNLEMLLVDDGSPDTCGSICDAYAQDDARIRVIHQENRGVSAARNAGIDAAQGEYLMFVDADDWIELDCVKLTLRETLAQGVDLLFFNEIKEYESESAVERGESRRLTREDIVAIADGLIGEKEAFNFMAASSWGCVIRTSLVKEQNIRFPERIRSGEDQYFNLCLFEQLECAYYLEYAGYHYRLHSESVCRRIDANAMQDAHNEILGIHRYLEAYHPADARRSELLGRHALGCVGMVEGRYLYHPQSTVRRRERIDIIAAYFADPLIAHYTAYLTAESFPTMKQRVKYHLLIHGHYGAYDLWRSVKTRMDRRTKPKVQGLDG